MTGPLAEKVEARLDALAPDGALGVALSGGGDSTALLVIAAGWAARAGRTLEAATVDHGLRPESPAEAASAARLAASLGLRHETLPWRDRPASGNLSAAAREARIALLGAWARRRGLAAVALGHTLDDQAETVLMRLARGAGVDGLAGMEARTARDGVAWIRPLLEVRRADLRAHLRAAGVAWAEDPTNEDPAYARIRMRRLIEASPDFDAAGLAAAAARLRMQSVALEWLADDLAARALRWGAAGEARLDIAAMSAAPEESRLRLLARVLGRISGAPYRPKRTSAAPLLAALMEGEAPARTLQGCVVECAGGTATLSREPAAADGTLDAAEGVVWDGRWRVEGAAPGARIARLGEAGEAALAAARRSGAWTPPEGWRAAPRAARLSSPAVWRGGALAAAPCAGYGQARAALLPPSDAWRPSRRDARAERDVTAH